ncbi:hypothetical protein [Clostridium neonatale]|uniref:hypothetical protein n=1 Tax=Clostridium neonatale TaxID=137838 RepID=UPI00291BB8A9|nr:hypothetical protein [Clostridium neonatale]CAI3654944.1 hypothetical protein CNEO4_2300004 [Clostridium neonatale]CAI3721902.1 hypothetical protein CNEO4_830040 [Clostridium neonatale]
MEINNIYNEIKENYTFEGEIADEIAQRYPKIKPNRVDKNNVALLEIRSRGVRKYEEKN